MIGSTLVLIVIHIILLLLLLLLILILLILILILLLGPAILYSSATSEAEPTLSTTAVPIMLKPLSSLLPMSGTWEGSPCLGPTQLLLPHLPQAQSHPIPRG